MPFRLVYRKKMRHRTPSGDIISSPEVIVTSDPMQAGMAIYLASQHISRQSLLHFLDEDGAQLSLEEAIRRPKGSGAETSPR